MQKLDEFLLNPEITYLNHGSFGASALPIFRSYRDWQLKIESDSVQFFTKWGPKALEESRSAMGKFISCDKDDLFFVPNPTFAINTIAHNVQLKPGDEILTTDLEYGAMDRTWNYYCDKAGAKYVECPIGLPVNSKEEIIEAVSAKMNSNTKILFISEITSTTAMKLPVHELCAIAKEKGITTIVDGAHSPGHIPVDLQKLQADYYTGACHKWMLTPKGASFLYVKKEFQKELDPLVFSWGYNPEDNSPSQFLDYHQLNGIRDYSAFLTIPAAVEYLNKIDWQENAKQCNEVILEAYPKFCALVGSEPLCPLSIDFLGHMCSIPISPKDPIQLKEDLFNEFKIEIPVMEHKGAVYLRISYHSYNDGADLEKLYEALKILKERGAL